MAFIKYLSDDDDSFYLEVGSEEKIYVSNEPVKFRGDVSYNIPDNNSLEEEAELSEINRHDNIEEQEELIENLETE